MFTIRGLWLLFLGANAVTLLAQNTPPRAAECFSIHVRLNGAPLESPEVITLRSKQNDVPVSLEGGCFKVSPALLAEKTLDVDFNLSGNRIYLTSISTGFFHCPWDMDLVDKKFDKEVRLPKHTRAREACVVVFHGGEPETELIQSRCRIPYKR
jgi:hypothetical protein